MPRLTFGQHAQFGGIWTYGGLQWTNMLKNITSFINQAKPSTSFTNLSKPTTTFTNQPKPT